MRIRIQKIIADAGLTSRRDAELWIENGRVTLNGRKATLGESADPREDTICVDNKPLPKKTSKTYVLLNKPKGYLSTTVAENGRRPVTDLVKINTRLYPVGRLDFDTEGLLLLTDDGNFSYALTHPKFEVQKTYRVFLSRPIKPDHLVALKTGIMVEGRRVDISSVKTVDSKCIEISIHEGRKHIVKKIFGSLNYHIERLVRTRIGSLELGKLSPGQFRLLTEKEVAQLLKR